MREIYLCSTYYHLLIAMQKAMIQKGRKPDLMVTDHIADGADLAGKIKKAHIFGNVYYSGMIQEYICRNRIDRFLFLHRRNSRLIEAQLTVDLKKYQNVYIFHEDTWMAHYMQDIRKPYELLEDALDSYMIIQETVWAYMVRRNLWKDIVRKYLRYGYQYAGASPCTISIEVNQKKGVCIPELGKVKEYPRRLLKRQLTDRQKEQILKLLGWEEPAQQEAASKMLLLTQPLFGDKIVKSVSEQIRVYKQLLMKYQDFFEKGGVLYIKPHPRDGIGYVAAFPKAVVLKRCMPVELLDFAGNFRFQIGISLFSTSLKGLECIDEKQYTRLESLMECTSLTYLKGCNWIEGDVQ